MPSASTGRSGARSPLPGRWRSAPGDPPRRQAACVAAVWVGLFVVAVLGGLIVEGNGFDGALVRSVARERTGAVTGAARALTNLGGLWLDVLFVAAVAVLLGVRRRGDAAFVLLAGAGSMLLTNAIKLVLERPRPSGGLVAVSSYSWPSGHAASSIAFYGAMAVLAGRRAPSARLLIWGCLGLLVGVIGATRVYLGVHYPSDVVAGWVVGGLWLLAVVMLVGAPTTRGPPS